jgi:hypothetical protein
MVPAARTRGLEAMSTVWIVAAVIGAGIVFLLVETIYLSVVLTWSDQKTKGLGYYGLPAADRARFKRSLRRHARLLYPILRLIGRTSSFTFPNASFQVQGIAGPKGTCTPESFERGIAYQAQPGDIFVATQMKCGTTWMQHIVYEVLLRGQGNIVESGRTMYALSAWIESVKSVPLEQAPRFGEPPSRIIKTHLPAQLCPAHPGARYIYVARHPASCFASCVDFVATNIGAAAPDLPAVEEWFCSRDWMWWGTWPDHVKGWWRRAQQQPNVLFLYFEQMKQDLPGTIRRVADFLGVAPLTADEVARIAEKTGFAYMQKYKDAFEMNPPHLLQTDAEMFVRGSADRHKDVPPDVRQRVLTWCAAQLEDSDFPVVQAYPDVAAARDPARPVAT